jgi:hypothetical protein
MFTILRIDQHRTQDRRKAAGIYRLRASGTGTTKKGDPFLTNRPCRMAAFGRSGCVPAEPYPPERKKHYTPDRPGLTKMNFEQERP